MGRPARDGVRLSGDVFRRFAEDRLGSEFLDQSRHRRVIRGRRIAAPEPGFRIFDRLAREHMTGIVDIQLGRLTKRLADRKIGISLDDEARTWLADRGYDPAYGARPLKRVIQKALEDPLAERILAGSVKDGTTVTVTASADGLIMGDAVVARPRLRRKIPRMRATR